MTTYKFNRRKFLRNASFTALGSGIATNQIIAQNTEDKNNITPKIKEYRKFGKTGFNVSDFSSGNPTNETVLKTLLERGVNLIDTGEAYYNGNSERSIGKVIKDFERDKLFINSKLHAEKKFPSKEEVVKRTNDSLERLETDYIDCMMIHSADNTTILKDEAFHAGMEQMKQEGKVRHIGVSCHGANWAYDTEESLDKILLAAVEDGRFDVILLAYNFVNSDIGEKVLEACDKKGIATIIMKSNPVYIFGLLNGRVEKLTKDGKEVDEYTKAFYDKYKVMQDSASHYFQEYGITNEKEILEAASKYVLTNPLAHTTVWDFRNFDDVEQILKLSGEKLKDRDKLVLNGYQQYLGEFSCRIGCNECEPACPHNIPINKIMRYNYYFGVKKQEKRAITKFARLQNKKPLEVCVDCKAYCEEACKYGVLARPLLAEAQKNLELIG